MTRKLIQIILKFVPFCFSFSLSLSSLFTQHFDSWFAKLNETDREKMTHKKRLRNVIEKAMTLHLDKSVEWFCTQCSQTNGRMFRGNKLVEPDEHCVCCGHNMRLRTPTGPAHVLDADTLLSALGTDRSDASSTLPSVVENVDPHIVRAWDELLESFKENSDDNQCHGTDSEYVESCPEIRKLQFIMELYSCFVDGKKAKDSGHTAEDIKYQIENISDVLNGLTDLGVPKAIEIFKHVSTVHFEPALFEYFEEANGKCDGRKCKMYRRNRTRNRTRNRNREMLDDDMKEEESALDDQDRVVISFLDKWHSFLFHANNRERQQTMEDMKRQMIRERLRASEESKRIDPNPDDLDADNPNLEALLGVNSENDPFGSEFNKFVSNSCLHSSAHATSGTSPGSQGLADILELDEKDEEYFEYGFGQEIKYHEHDAHYKSLKEEITQNPIHSISETAWNDTLAKAMYYVDCPKIQEEYTSNRHDIKYGVEMEGQPISVMNVVAILLYCNYDALQAEFSRTFRGLSNGDEEFELVVTRHCENFYWFGRSLFIAINFHGKHMDSKAVVWHGLSQKMVFKTFGTLYFDSPTSTTTAVSVAQGFSGSDGKGVILKLKSKYKGDFGAVMLDVGPFSDFTDGMWSVMICLCSGSTRISKGFTA